MSAPSNLIYEQYFFAPDHAYLQSGASYVSWAGYRECDTSHVIGPRVLDTYKLVFVLSGRGYLTQDSHEPILLQKNDMFLLHASHRHHYWADPDDPWTITWAAFNGADVPYLLNAAGITDRNYVLRNVLTEPLEKAMTKLVNGLADDTDLCRLEALTQLFRIFNMLRRNLTPPASETDDESLVSSLTAFIEQNYYMEIDMNMLCGHTHYSRSYLSRMFKAKMGLTIQEFLIDTRINHAKNLLLETELPIQEISASVGIRDSLYFSRTFHRKTGFSPSEYRKRFSD